MKTYRIVLGVQGWNPNEEETQSYGISIALRAESDGEAIVMALLRSEVDRQLKALRILSIEVQGGGK